MATATKSRRASTRRQAPGRAVPRDMTRQDICNVEPVTHADTIGLLKALGELDLLDDEERATLGSMLDERWELTDEEGDA